VTVAVAGAGAVPSLLLRPAAETIPFEQTFAAAAVVSRRAEPKPVEAKLAEAPKPTTPKPAEPKQADEKPSPAPTALVSAAAVLPPAVASAPVALETPRQVAFKPEPKPAPASAAAAPAPPVAPPPMVVGAAPVAATPEAPRPAPAEAFPPVQPIEAAVRREAVPDGARSIRARSAARKWIRLARGHFARMTSVKRGTVRPAAYPIREFLAWRR